MKIKKLSLLFVLIVSAYSQNTPLLHDHTDHAPFLQAYSRNAPLQHNHCNATCNREEKEIYSTEEENIEEFGMCEVSLPQNEKFLNCIEERQQTTMEARQYYQLTNPSTNDIIAYPTLNQSNSKIELMSRLDPLDSSWFTIYYTMISEVNQTAQDLINNGYIYKRLKTYQDYKDLFEVFTAKIKALPSSKYFVQPMHEEKEFLDTTVNDMWREDKMFVQRRFAGPCPFFVRKVNDKFDDANPVGIDSRTLLQQLNQTFDWDSRLSKVIGEAVTMQQAIHSGRLYVLYHEEYNELPRTPDILDLNTFDTNVMLESPSPIAVFLRDKHGELKTVAIQMNYTQDSRVITPNLNDMDDYDWLMAKGFVEIANVAVCQFKGHFITHSTQEIFCNLFRRTLSPRHPLAQLMTLHCHGTTPVGALGMPPLFDEGRFMHQLFDFGHMGAKMILKKAYLKQHYDDADLPLQLKKAGLYDTKINYYPYRDDGLVIWDEIRKFATKYTNLEKNIKEDGIMENYHTRYYASDADILHDTELQLFVNEVSADGDYINGGKYKGFPSKFTNKDDLITFLTRFIWLVINHAADSYPLYPNGVYLPIVPSKLYYDRRKGHLKNFVDSLPDAANAVAQEVLSLILSGIRVNRLFDYAIQLTDQEARELVTKTYNNLNTNIQRKLRRRNKERFVRRDMTYHYMEPKYLPNSIHS